MKWAIFVLSMLFILQFYPCNSSLKPLGISVSSTILKFLQIFLVDFETIFTKLKNMDFTLS